MRNHDSSINFLLMRAISLVRERVRKRERVWERGWESERERERGKIKDPLNRSPPLPIYRESLRPSQFLCLTFIDRLFFIRLKNWQRRDDEWAPRLLLERHLWWVKTFSDHVGVILPQAAQLSILFWKNQQCFTSSKDTQLREIGKAGEKKVLHLAVFWAHDLFL